MTPSEVLLAAADLIEPEGAWTQRAFARDRHGTALTARSYGAVCWCADGAIIHSAGDEAYLHGPCLAAVYRIIPDTLLINHWNDAPDRTQAEVVAALREAAANG